LNSERLTESYQLLAASLQQWDVQFVQPTHGIFLFAKLAKNARTAEDEKRFFDSLALQGVRVGAGRFYKGVELEYGWARIRFSVSKEVMATALAKIGSFLDSNA
jgi:DNA-binding transcriptional MocR family regulator